MVSEVLNTLDKKIIIEQIEKQFESLDLEHVRSHSQASINNARISIDIRGDSRIRDAVKSFLVNKFGVESTGLKFHDGKLTVTGAAVYSIKYFLDFYNSLDESGDDNPFYLFRRLASPFSGPVDSLSKRINFTSFWFERRVEELTTLAELRTLKRQYESYLKDKYVFTNAKLKEILEPATQKIASLEPARAMSPAASSVATTSTPPPAQNESSNGTVMVDLVEPAQSTENILVSVRQKLHSLSDSVIGSRDLARSENPTVTFECHTAAHAEQIKNHLFDRLGFDESWSVFNGSTNELTISGEAIYNLRFAETSLMTFNLSTATLVRFDENHEEWENSLRNEVQLCFLEMRSKASHSDETKILTTLYRKHLKAQFSMTDEQIDAAVNEDMQAMTVPAAQPSTSRPKETTPENAPMTNVNRTPSTEEKQSIAAQIERQINDSMHTGVITLTIPEGITKYMLGKYSIRVPNRAFWEFTVEGNALNSLKYFHEFYKELNNTNINENPFDLFSRLTSPATSEKYSPALELKLANFWFKERVEELTTPMELIPLKIQFEVYLNNQHILSEPAIREHLKPASEKIAALLTEKTPARELSPVVAARSPVAVTTSTPRPTQNRTLTTQEKQNITAQIERQTSNVWRDGAITLNLPGGVNVRSYMFGKYSIYVDQGPGIFKVNGNKLTSLQYFHHFYKELNTISINENPFDRFLQLGPANLNKKLYSKGRQIKFADLWFQDRVEELTTRVELTSLKEHYANFLRNNTEYDQAKINSYLHPATEKLERFPAAVAPATEPGPVPAVRPEIESSPVIVISDMPDRAPPPRAEPNAVTIEQIIRSARQQVALMARPLRFANEAVAFDCQGADQAALIKNLLLEQLGFKKNWSTFNESASKLTISLSRERVFYLGIAIRFYDYNAQRFDDDENREERENALINRVHGTFINWHSKTINSDQEEFLTAQYRNCLKTRFSMTDEQVDGALQQATQASAAARFRRQHTTPRPNETRMENPPMTNRIEAMVQARNNLVAQIERQLSAFYLLSYHGSEKRTITLEVNQLNRRFDIPSFLKNKFGVRSDSLTVSEGNVTVKGAAVYSIKHFHEFYKSLNNISHNANPFDRFLTLTSPSTKMLYGRDRQLKFANLWFRERVQELTTRVELTSLKDHYADFLRNKITLSEPLIRAHLASGTRKLQRLPAEAAPAPAAESTPPPTQDGGGSDTVVVDLVGPDSAPPPRAEPDVVTFEQLMQSVTQQVALMPREISENPLSFVNSFVNQRVALAFDCQGADQAALIKDLLLKHLGFNKDWSTFNESTSKLTISGQAFVNLSIAKRAYDVQAANRAVPAGAPTAASLAASNPVFTTSASQPEQPSSGDLLNGSTDASEPRAIAAPPLAASSPLFSRPASRSARRRRPMPGDLADLSNNGLKRLKLMLRNEELNREAQKVEAQRERLQAERQRVAQELDVIVLSDDESPALN